MIFFVLMLLATGLLTVTVRERCHLAKNAVFLRVAVACAFVGAALFSLPNLYILEKLVGRLIMPTGIFWTVLLASIFWAIYQKRPKLTAVFSGLFVCYSLVGNLFLGGFLISVLERDFQIEVMKQDPFDAVLVLGGGATGGLEFAQVNDAGDRVVLGARMYHAQLTPLLLTSGSSIPGLGSFVDVSVATTTIWTGLGVPENAILRIPDPKNTREEILALTTLKSEKQWRRVGLITSAWHMRRAMKLAEKAGVEVHPLPADFRTRMVWDGILTIVPDAYGFMLVQRACWEFLGAATGR